MQKTTRVQTTNSRPAEPVNQSRRKALKTIAAGSAAAGALAMTGKWSKPVVNSIILPAHAQATNAAAPIGTTTPAPACTTQVTFACYAVDLGKAAHGKLVLPLAGVQVQGDITPIQAGVAITVEIRTILINQSSRTDTLQTTTDSSGSFNVTKAWTANDGVASISGVTVTGPCNSLDAQPCAT